MAVGKTPYDKRFGEPFNGPVIPCGSLVEYHPIAAKDQSRIHQVGKKVLPGLFLGYALYEGGIWKGDVLIADLEESETMDASEIDARRLNAKEIVTPKRGDFFVVRSQMEQQNCLEETNGVRESILRRNQPVRSEDLREDLQGNSEKSQATDEAKVDVEARNDFWSVKGDISYRHHVEPRVQLQVPKGETCPVPLKIDVARTAHTTLDVLQESRIDDCWSIDANRNLSGPESHSSQ